MRRITVVTGAGRGIGRAVALALAPDGPVAGFDTTYPEPRTGEALALTADVRDPAAVARAMDRVRGTLGRIDAVVCAAGITRDRVSWKLTDAEWDDVLGVNLTGAFNVVRAATPDLRASDAGRVVLIASINGLRGRFGQANYAAAKAGLIGLGRTLALELARDGVTVNIVAPGFIDTAMTQALGPDARDAAVRRTPLGRIGQPADVAAAVRFFLSREAAFITGTVLPVDGGQLLGEVAA